MGVAMLFSLVISRSLGDLPSKNSSSDSPNRPAICKRLPASGVALPFSHLCTVCRLTPGDLAERLLTESLLRT